MAEADRNQPVIAAAADAEIGRIEQTVKSWLQAVEGAAA
jgi:hypothetical protein